jgi:hypothetical protein
MINTKRLLGIPAATGDAVIGKAEAPNPVIDWNDTAITTALAANQVTFARPNQPKVRTMNRKQSWKPLCGLLVLLFIPLTGRSDVVQDWNAIMQATVSSQPPFPQASICGDYPTCRIRGGRRNDTTIQAVPRNDNRAQRYVA